MADEDIYENRRWLALPAAEKAPKIPAPSPHPKRTIPIAPLLAVLVLLLVISLVTLAILYSQKERKLQELEGVIQKFRNSLQLTFFSPGNKTDSSRLSDAQLLQSISNASLAIQARLGTAASQAAAEERYRELLELLSKGWKFYNGSWYFFSEDKKPWREAEEACASHGAHLTSVTSRNEMEYISRKTKGQPFFIGLTDQQEEGNWTWVDGTKYNKDVSFWESEQPDNWHGAPGHQEDCVQVRSNDVLNSWNDISCTICYKWICKKIF